jgi:arylsulfatase A-like enzyme
MRRHRTIASCALAALVLTLALGWVGCRPGLSARPNVVLVIVDTLRADALGCYGAALDTSPELDDLASRGVRFADVLAQNSWTRPSIGSMLTGRHARSLGLYHEQVGGIGDEFTTLAEVLQDNGYATFGITANPHLNRYFNFHQGFDEYIDSNTVFRFMDPEGQMTLAVDVAVTAAVDLYRPVLEFARGNDSTPAYVQINMMDVHEWSRGELNLTRPEYESLFGKVAFADYYRSVRQASADLHEFIEQLRALPGWDDTLFVIVSDHGEGLGSHPHVENSSSHGWLLYESQLRVPLVLYREGWEFAGQVIHQPVRLLDLMPTLLEILSLPVPADLDGVSLAPALADPRAHLGLPEYFVAETELKDARKQAVYGTMWKYFVNHDDHPGTDPLELQPMGIMEDGSRSNRLDTDPATAEVMGRFLEDWLQRYPKQAPTRNTQSLSPEELEQLRAIGYFD